MALHHIFAVLLLVITVTAKCYGFLSPLRDSRSILLPLHLSPSSTNVRNKDTSESEWKETLSPERYYVLREEGTERAWTSALNDLKDEGIFCCGGCGAPLYTSSMKYESGSGWPSFYAPIDEDAVDLNVDYKLVMPRTEVSCKCCGGHLGHVFDDGPQPTGKRYCMNGVAMDFVMEDENPQLAAAVDERISKSRGGLGMIKQPLMAILPGLVIDAVVAALFISSFFHKHGNESGGLDLFVDGSIEVSQFLELIPFGIGTFYMVLALQKVPSLVESFKKKLS